MSGVICQKEVKGQGPAAGVCSLVKEKDCYYHWTSKITDIIAGQYTCNVHKSSSCFFLMM